MQVINACTNGKDDRANKEMSTRQTNNRLSPEAGKAASTNRKTQQLAINNKPDSTVKRRGWQEAVTDYYKFHYGGEAQKIAMYKDLNDTTDHKFLK